MTDLALSKTAPLPFTQANFACLQAFQRQGQGFNQTFFSLGDKQFEGYLKLHPGRHQLKIILLLIRSGAACRVNGHAVPYLNPWNFANGVIHDEWAFIANLLADLSKEQVRSLFFAAFDQIGAQSASNRRPGQKRLIRQRVARQGHVEQAVFITTTYMGG